MHRTCVFVCTILLCKLTCNYSCQVNVVVIVISKDQQSSFTHNWENHFFMELLCAQADRHVETGNGQTQTDTQLEEHCCVKYLAVALKLQLVGLRREWTWLENLKAFNFQVFPLLLWCGPAWSLLGCLVVVYESAIVSALSLCMRGGGELPAA